MMTQQQEQYYALVSKKTNKLILIDSSLPIFWRLSVALKKKKLFKDSKIIRIYGDDLSNILNG